MPQDSNRPWRKLYATTAWQKIRAWQLAQQPLCEECLSIGVVTPATDVHHVEAHKGDLEKFWNGPFRSDCASCHSRWGQKEDHGKSIVRFDADGWPT